MKYDLTTILDKEAEDILDERIRNELNDYPSDFAFWRLLDEKAYFLSRARSISKTYTATIPADIIAVMTSGYSVHFFPERLHLSKESYYIWYNDFYTALFSFIGEVCEGVIDILDIGCSSSATGFILKEHFQPGREIRYTGIDANADSIDIAKLIYQSQGMRYFNSSFEGLDLNTEENVILLINTLKHIINDKQLISPLLAIIKSSKKTIIFDTKAVLQSFASSVLSPDCNYTLVDKGQGAFLIINYM